VRVIIGVSNITIAMSSSGRDISVGLVDMLGTQVSPRNNIFNWKFFTFNLAGFEITTVHQDIVVFLLL